MVLDTIGSKKINLHKIAFELRYKQGFTYLDRCGRTVNSIMAEYPEWILRSDSPNPQAAPLVSLQNGCKLDMSSYKINFILEQAADGEPLNKKDAENFSEQVDALSKIIISSLSLNEFTRIGARIFYLVPFEKMEDAEKWVQSLGYFSVSDSLLKRFGGTVESTAFTARLTLPDKKVSVSTNLVERNAQFDIGDNVINVNPRALPTKQKEAFIELQKQKHKRTIHPPFGIMIDADVFLEDISEIKLSETFLKTFILSGFTSVASALKG